METFIMSRDGGQLKELASAIGSLFKRKNIKDQIKSLYHNFKPVKGMEGRDLELLVGMPVLVRIIESETPNLKLSDRVLKIAISATEKRDDETFFLDWNSQFLISVANLARIRNFDSNAFYRGDEITAHVTEEVSLPFKLRTGGLGRVLDRESILIERKVKWFRDDKGNQIHKTGWRIDVDRLRRKVSKFHKYIQPREDSPVNQGFSSFNLADILENNPPDFTERS